MEEGSAIAEHLVVASGRTTKHIHAVAQQLAGLLRAQGVKVLVKPAHKDCRGLLWSGRRSSDHLSKVIVRAGEEVSVEGRRDDDWQVVDGGGCVFSLFLPATRQHYDLEGLWTALIPPPHACGRMPTRTMTTRGSTRRVGVGISMTC